MAPRQMMFWFGPREKDPRQSGVIYIPWAELQAADLLLPGLGVNNGNKP